MIKIAVASGKGGTGKTLVATNIFYSLMAENYKVVLIDCDAEAPNAAAFFDRKLIEKETINQIIPEIYSSACTFCGKCHDWCNYNAIFIIPPAKIITVIDDLCHACGACFEACHFNAIKEKSVSLGEIAAFMVNQQNLFPLLDRDEPKAKSGFSNADRVTVSVQSGKDLLNEDGYRTGMIIESRMKVGVMSPVKLIKTAINKIDPANDIAILDAPPGTSCPFIQTTATADFVVLVTEPTPFGLSDLKQSVETLRQMNRSFGVIINRAGIGNRDVYNYLENNHIPLLMEIPYDPQIAMLYSKGLLAAQRMTTLKEKLVELMENISNILINN